MTNDIVTKVFEKLNDGPRLPGTVQAVRWEHIERAILSADYIIDDIVYVIKRQRGIIGGGDDER